MNGRFGRWGGLRLGFGASRVPVILQTEGAECGLACLAMVAAAHGHRSDLPTLRQRFSLSLKGVNLLDMVRMAEDLKLHARALRAEIEDLAQLEHPSILHWDMNHFVVLVGVSRGVATIHDPAHGLRRLKLDQVSRHFTGVVLELTPAADFVPREEKQHVSPRQMLGRITGLKRSLAQIFALALALEAFMLLSPFLMQWVVDDVLVSASHSPSTGCWRRRRAACSACRAMPSAAVPPYSVSATSGWPIELRCTRIWCVRPLCSLQASALKPPAAATRWTSVRAGLPPATTAMRTRDTGSRPIGASMLRSAHAGSPCATAR